MPVIVHINSVLSRTILAKIQFSGSASPMGALDQDRVRKRGRSSADSKPRTGNSTDPGRVPLDNCIPGVSIPADESFSIYFIYKIYPGAALGENIDPRAARKVHESDFSSCRGSPHVEEFLPQRSSHRSCFCPGAHAFLCGPA